MRPPGARRVLALGLVAAILALAVSCTSSDGSTPAAGEGAATSTSAGGRGEAAVDDSPTAIAQRAAVAGYPLVVTRRIMATFAQLAGVNTLLRVPRLANADSRIVVAPNRDTLYALAILDLRGEPQALTVPAIERYHTFQFIDAWMQTIGNVGTRATGGRAGTWVVTPPGWTGRLPAGAHRIESPTDDVVILGRIRAVDDADAPAAFAAGAGLALQPLSALTGSAAAPAPAKMAPPVGRPEQVGQNGLGYYDELGDALEADPPVNAEQRRALAPARALGVGAGLHPSETATGQTAKALEAGLEGANAIAGDLEGARLGSTVEQGWSVNLHLSDPEQRQDLRAQAVIARNYWGPNVAEEAVYPVAVRADDGKALDGSKRYVIHLPGDDLPPVRAFWSFTVYGPDSFFVANPQNRFSISSDTPGLVRQADGSIDIHLSADPPAGHEANWIPTPEGPYRLLMRLYLPESSVLDGTYRYPPVRVVR